MIKRVTYKKTSKALLTIWILQIVLIIGLIGWGFLKQTNDTCNHHPDIYNYRGGDYNE